MGEKWERGDKGIFGCRGNVREQGMGRQRRQRREEDTNARKGGGVRG